MSSGLGNFKVWDRRSSVGVYTVTIVVLFILENKFPQGSVWSCNVFEEGFGFMVRISRRKSKVRTVSKKTTPPLCEIRSNVGT